MIEAIVFISVIAYAAVMDPPQKKDVHPNTSIEAPKQQTIYREFFTSDYARTNVLKKGLGLAILD